MQDPIKILIADAQYLIRLGLKCMLQKDNRIKITGMVDEADEMFRELKRQTPDVLIIDYNHAPQFHIEDVDKVRLLYPDVNIIIITDDVSRNNVNRLLEKGNMSFLTKTCDKEEITGAVFAASKSEKFLCNKVIDIILERKQDENKESCVPACLTQRELEIIQYTAKGYSAKKIADSLFLSTHTVYTHRKNILRKLNMRSSSELIVFALNNGIASREEEFSAS